MNKILFEYCRVKYLIYKMTLLQTYIKYLTIPENLTVLFRMNPYNMKEITMF